MSEDCNRYLKFSVVMRIQGRSCCHQCVEWGWDSALMYCESRLSLCNGLTPVQVRATSEIWAVVWLLGLGRRVGAVSAFNVGEQLRRAQSLRHQAWQRCPRQAEPGSVGSCREELEENQVERGPIWPSPGLALGAAGIFISAAKSRPKDKGWKKLKTGMICPYEKGRDI